MVSLGFNPEGNQLDPILLSTGQDDVFYDVNFESKAGKSSDSYHLELKISYLRFLYCLASHFSWLNTIAFSSLISQQSTKTKTIHGSSKIGAFKFFRVIAKPKKT
jgi:hypothetical protein